MIKVKLIEDKKIWDEFVSNVPIHTFFHSFEWADFNQNIGDQPEKYGFFEDNKLVGVALIVKVFAKRGTFLFCPHGPLFISDKINYWHFFLKFFIKKGQEKKVVFVRISPALAEDNKISTVFKKNEFKNAPIHMSAESSWILDLTNKSEDQILSEMRKTTRYEIRQAQKRGYEVVKSTDLKDLKIFLKLYHQTVTRTNFIPFSDKYITEEFLAFSKNNQVMLFLEKHNNKIVAALMIIFYGKGAFYHQGATNPSGKETVSYLAQWEAIKEAKKRGCTFYNFWGIAPIDDPKHPWYGLSLFKKGFGGKRVNFVHAQDYSIKFWRYLPIYVLETIRRLKRNL